MSFLLYPPAPQRNANFENCLSPDYPISQSCTLPLAYYSLMSYDLCIMLSTGDANGNMTHMILALIADSQQDFMD